MHSVIDKIKQKIEVNNRIICNIMSKDLFEIPITLPYEQRLLDSDKVNEIVLYQQNELKNKGHCNFLGNLNIHYCNENQKNYLVDGQHRYEAIKIISKTNNIPVIIDYVQVDTMKALKENFELINKNTPLPEFSENIDKNIPETVALQFKQEYRNIWSKTTRANRPTIYFTFFQEALGVITEKLKISSAAELQKIIKDYNEKLSNWDYSMYPDPKTVSDAMIQKCLNTGMYLGLYKHISDDYGYEWVKEIVYQHTGENMKKTKKPITNNKKTIPKTLKMTIWNENIGKNIRTAYCICCNNNEIKVEDFHAGHIIAESAGGETNQTNLLPICAICNTSMGTTNMNDFVKSRFPDNFDNFISRKYTIPKNKKGIFARLGL